MTNEEAIQFLKNMKGEEAGRAIGKEGFYAELLGYHIEALDTAIEALKDERAKGKWIEHQDCHDDTYYTCSHCGEDWTTIEGDPMDNLMNYCPMCGADMREDGKQ